MTIAVKLHSEKLVQIKLGNRNKESFLSEGRTVGMMY